MTYLKGDREEKFYKHSANAFHAMGETCALQH